jgi:hypothetical protein
MPHFKLAYLKRQMRTLKKHTKKASRDAAPDFGGFLVDSREHDLSLENIHGSFGARCLGPQ